MHINTEMLECVYFVTSMLLEVPYMAQNTSSGSSHRYSRHFRRTLQGYCRQHFNGTDLWFFHTVRSNTADAGCCFSLGPPETNKDFILSASLAMKAGNWRKAVKNVTELKIWTLFKDADGIRAMLKTKIQEQSLRTYLFAFSGFYDSLSIPSLRY